MFNDRLKQNKKIIYIFIYTRVIILLFTNLNRLDATKLKYYKHFIEELKDKIEFNTFSLINAILHHEQLTLKIIRFLTLKERNVLSKL